jgi:activator of HSP90 ATPase
MDKLKVKTIQQTATIKATRHAVYEALMDSKQHGQFTGGAAKISRKVGGKFSVYDGYASGKNLKLIPDRKIVQTWRADDWPDGHYSQCTFELTPTKTGTKLTFTQTDVPVEFYKDIKQGWIDFYWKPMKELLES